MNITFLGTGAAEGIPSPFCNCGTCQHARDQGGRNVRRRQCFLINDDLLLDVGPDLFASCAQFGISLVELRYLLVTHNHLDHFTPSNLQLRAKPFRLSTELPDLAMVAGPSVLATWDLSGGRDSDAGIRRIPFLPGRSVSLSPYKVRSIEATHNLRIGDAMNYIIDDGRVKILIASDTGIYDESIWEQLANEAFDTVIMEATLLNHTPGKEHLNLQDFRIMLDRMRQTKVVRENTVIVASHFSHQSVGSHDNTDSILAEIGVTCAFDGMKMTVSSHEN
jgi:phosphoribosyl 1,2-cyclic phosphate phosphodiesterase